jgi:hypothetical protein
LGLFILVLVCGCGNMQSVFSEQAYQQAVSLKVESLELMDKATEAFSEHEQEVAILQTNLQKAYQYAQGRPNNEITTRQWEILIDPERNLLGGFMVRWKQQNSMSESFIEENKGILSDAFDTIIELESGKRKPSDLE